MGKVEVCGEAVAGVKEGDATGYIEAPVAWMCVSSPRESEGLITCGLKRRRRVT